jgi:hypothetical protein
MRELNSQQMGTTAGALARLPRPVSFADGRGCARLRVEVVQSMKNNTGGPLDYTGARAKKLIEGLFKTSTLRFGDRHADVVDNALDFARLREMCLALTGDDFIIVHPTTGVPTRLASIADADVLKAAVAAGASFLITMEIARPFEVVRLGEDAYAYCPGASQLRQVQWEFVRGSAVDTAGGEFVQNGAADLLFVADDFETGDDKWAAVPRLYQQEEAGRESHGPRAPSGLLSVWEYSAVGASTALTLFSITREGDAPLHDNVRAARVVRDALYTDPTGAYDLNLLATVLHQIPDNTEKNEIPVGEGWKFLQTGTELSPPKTAWLHVPARSEEEHDNTGKNVEGDQGVKMISAAAKSAKGMSSPAASLEPVIMARQGSADFEALPGRVVARGLSPTTHVPASVANAAAASVSGDPEAASAAASKVATAIAKAIPGGVATRRGRKTPVFASLARRWGLRK